MFFSQNKLCYLSTLPGEDYIADIKTNPCGNLHSMFECNGFND